MTMRLHDWTKSTLGHGTKMCRNCLITDLEAAAISRIYCDEELADPVKKPDDNMGNVMPFKRATA